jgi:hypothetical protein
LKRYLLICVFIADISKAAVSPFRNLGFDEANTNHVFDLNGDNTYYYGPISDLLPGWQLSTGTNASAPNDLIGFNLSLPGSGYATLYSTNGNFSLGLWPGVDLLGLGGLFLVCRRICHRA